jgi:hypothetical protein
MTKTLVDLLIGKRKRDEKYFQNYLSYVKKIKRVANDVLGEVKIFVFGSLIRGEAEPGSDIDILIISPKLKNFLKKSKIRTKILEEIGSISPFEIHLITPEEYQNWYKNFIKEKIEI